MPPRVDTKPLMETPVTVAATDSKTESDNVATVTKVDDAYIKGDVAAVLDGCSDDFTFMTNPMPGEMKGKAMGKKALEGGNKAWSDRKSNTIASFGAGDYVVTISEMTATNSGDFAMMKMKKTGKTVTTKSMMITHLTGGKVDKMWGFENSEAFYTQLGVMKPMMPPPAGAAAGQAAGEKMEGDKKAPEGEAKMEGDKKPEGEKKASKKKEKAEPSAKPAAPNE